MGATAFSAQYQQDPTPPGGNRMRWEWFGSYEEEPRRAEFLWIAQSWDTGLTAEPTSDYSVGMTWGFKENRWYLLNLVRERLDFPDLRRRARSQAEQWEADLVLIEKAGSGYPLLQQLRHEDEARGGRYQYRTPRVDKVTRFEAQTANLETGRYLIPKRAPWLEEFRRELLAFPYGRHDDQVDSLVQFLDWAGSAQGAGFVERDPRTGRPSRVNRPQGRPFR